MVILVILEICLLMLVSLVILLMYLMVMMVLFIFIINRLCWFKCGVFLVSLIFMWYWFEICLIYWVIEVFFFVCFLLKVIIMLLLNLLCKGCKNNVEGWK